MFSAGVASRFMQRSLIVMNSGVSAVVEAYVSLRRRGGGLALLRPSGRVLLVLKVIHLLEIIPNFEDEAEALARFQPKGYSATPGSTG